jgi:hypothetical protein
MGQLASGDLYLGIGAAVGLALMTLVSIKLYRENVEMRRVMKERQAAEFLDGVYKAHPEARPLPMRYVLVAFLGLLVGFVALLVASRR